MHACVASCSLKIAGRCLVGLGSRPPPYLPTCVPFVARSRRTSAEEPILLNTFDSISASSEIELSDAASPLAGSSPRAKAAFSAPAGDGQPHGQSPRRSSSKAPGFATIEEEVERLAGRSWASTPHGSPKSPAVSD